MTQEKPSGPPRRLPIDEVCSLIKKMDEAKTAREYQELKLQVLEGYYGRSFRRPRKKREKQ
jgi:hypothetical protein